MYLLRVVVMMRFVATVTPWSQCQHLESEVGGELGTDGWVVYGPPGESMSLTRMSGDENRQLQAQCGQRQEQRGEEAKLAGGEAATPGQFPWVGGLAYVDNGHWKFCTAVIIGPRHVLTAAHCFYSFPDKNNPLPCKGATPFKHGFQMDVIHGGVCAQEGDACQEEDVKRVRIRKVVLPLDFVGRDCTCGNDLAIVEVETPIEFDSLTEPMCLVDFAMHLDKSTLRHLTEQLGTIYDVGWGKFKGKSSQRLRHFTSKISEPSLKDDDHTIRSEPTFSEPRVEERPGYCQGDSGGPLFGDYMHSGRMVLIGIHSYGDDCQTGSDHFIRNSFVAAYTGLICEWTGICTSYRVVGDT